jgi:hypothetical protein
MNPARMCLESLDRRPGIRERPGSRAEKSHFEQIWSALPQTADIDYGREDFSVGPGTVIRPSEVTDTSRLLFARGW